MRVVRAADGTGFVIAIANAAVPADYRLRFTFLSDNRAADPSSLVLSEQGNTGAEIATLDVFSPPRRL